MGQMKCSREEICFLGQSVISPVCHMYQGLVSLESKRFTYKPRDVSLDDE